MKTLIVYRSFLGSSKRYAGWLHEMVPSDIMKFSKANDRTLGAYEAVVLFGGTYAGHLSLADYLQHKWNTLKAKRVVFVTVGGAPETEAVSMKAYSSLPENIRSAESISTCGESSARPTPPRSPRKRSSPSRITSRASR